MKDVVTGTDYKVPKRSCVINFEVSSLVGISCPITAANILKAPTSFVSRPPLISYQRKFSFNALIRRHTAALQAEVIAFPLEPPARPSFRTPIAVSIRYCWEYKHKRLPFRISNFNSSTCPFFPLNIEFFFHASRALCFNIRIGSSRVL